MATDDRQVIVAGQAPAPASWKVPGNGQITPRSVFAHFDGSAAASSFKPALKVISDGGTTVGVYPCDTQIAPGGSADVSWFPRLSAATSASSGSGPAVLFDKVLGATTANFDTGAGGLDQTHKDLLVVSYLRTDEAIVLREDGAILIDNDSTAADYKTQRIRIQNTTVDGWLGTASTGFNCLMCAGASAPAGVYAYSFCYIPNYTAAVQHGGIGIEAGIGSFTDQPNWWMYVTNSRHNQAEAITQIQVTPNIGGGARFVAGSRLTIYGMG